MSQQAIIDYWLEKANQDIASEQVKEIIEQSQAFVEEMKRFLKQ